MERLLIIKTGETLPSLLRWRGDFEDWILSGMGVRVGDVTVLDVRGGSRLPKYGGVRGVVITGSHDSVTEHSDWSERTAGWLPGVVERRIPLLGICYGHQLLAYALGGEVGDNPNGREFGTLEIELTEAAGKDELLGLPNPLRMQLCHTQAVLRLPDGATRLASSELDPNQAFVAGERAWGVQFHPEFDAEITRAYIRHYRQELTAEEQDVNKLLTGCHDTAWGPMILQRFAAIIGLNSGT
jgi:GMP synthase (glutamine-hydrolysing)